MLLNNQRITEEIKEEIKRYLETNDNEDTTPNLWDIAKAVLKGKFTSILPQERRKSSNKKLNFALKQLEKEEQSPKLAEGKKS